MGFDPGCIVNKIQETKIRYHDRSVFPVIVAVPEKERQLQGRQKVVTLSRLARRALEMSAEKTGVSFINPVKDKKGVPLPFNGYHWSLSHKREYVGGVIGRERIGIDIEKIRECSPGLFKKTADQSEWDLGNDDRFTLFFRYWTSKEAVLKAVGTGIKGLSKCTIVKIVDDHTLVACYRNQNWIVEHRFFDGYIASVTKGSFIINWVVINEPVD